MCGVKDRNVLVFWWVWLWSNTFCTLFNLTQIASSVSHDTSLIIRYDLGSRILNTIKDNTIPVSWSVFVIQITLEIYKKNALALVKLLAKLIDSQQHLLPVHREYCAEFIFLLSLCTVLRLCSQYIRHQNTWYDELNNLLKSRKGRENFYRVDKTVLL